MCSVTTTLKWQLQVKRLKSGEYDAHSSADMMSGVICRRNRCVTFLRSVTEHYLAGIQSGLPDKFDDIQAVRKSSTD